MTKIRFLSVVIILALTASVFMGCGSKNNAKTEDKGDISSLSSVPVKVYSDFPDKLTAEKTAAFKSDTVTLSGGGLFYKADNNLYAVVNYSTGASSGAKFVSCKAEKDYFLVTSNSALPEVNNVDSMNIYGLVNSDGKVLIPEEYAYISVLNYRYAKVYKAEGQADKNKALLYLNDNGISVTSSASATALKGYWNIYDIEKGSIIEGVKCTNKYMTYAYGNLVKYVSDKKITVIIGNNGKALDKSTVAFVNGYYLSKTKNGYSLYDINAVKVKDFKKDEFIPVSSSEKYFIAQKGKGDKARYAIMNNKGTVISKELEALPEIYGELLFVDGKVLNINGEAVIEGSYDSINFDETLDNCWALKNDSETVFIKKDGTKLYSGRSSEETKIDTSFYLISKESANGISSFYCFKDKDFSLEGYEVGPWMIRTPNTGVGYDLIDTISGDTLLKGFNAYSFKIASDGYLYVCTRTGDFNREVYRIK